VVVVLDQVRLVVETMQVLVAPVVQQIQAAVLEIRPEQVVDPDLRVIMVQGD
jgi:hypothetical protein